MVRKFALPATLLLAVIVTACAAPVIQGGRYANDQRIINQNVAAAQQGDAAAQTRVGEAYCCAIDDRSPFYDNQKATEWLCQAAHAGHGPAQHRLARIYSGRLVSGLAGPQRIGQAISPPPEDRALALMWLKLAARNGVTDAAGEAPRLAGEMTATERARHEMLISDWANAPCTWNEVFPKTAGVDISRPA